MRVLLVTPWNEPCGIAEHSWYLKESVERADREIAVEPSAAWLNPAAVPWLAQQPDRPLLHLNYHAALHSRWTPDAIRLKRDEGYRVLVTYHDTGVPNSQQCLDVCGAADEYIVHEPCDDLVRANYWRMGVPGWVAPMQLPHIPDSWCGLRPVLGSIGFPFPWKHYTELAKITGRAGWALLLIAPNATEAQWAEWRAYNRHLLVYDKFMSRGHALATLAGCDATAFTYVCHNTGQSGAILQGIATRKPVLALSTCRQFRALYEDPLARGAIGWCATFEEVYKRLTQVPISRVDPGIVALAEQDSWASLGAKYAALYRELA